MEAWALIEECRPNKKKNRNKIAAIWDQFLIQKRQEIQWTLTGSRHQGSQPFHYVVSHKQSTCDPSVASLDPAVSKMTHIPQHSK